MEQKLMYPFDRHILEVGQRYDPVFPEMAMHNQSKMLFYFYKNVSHNVSH